MKKILIVFIQIICVLQAYSQTINLVDNGCLIGPDVVTLNGNDGGTPQRNIFTGTANNGSFPFRIIWDNGNNRWEVQADTDGNGSFETEIHGSSFASVPNPPNLGTGAWSDLTGGMCGSLTQFDGSGTQNFLPVELIDFVGMALEGRVLLLWQTASELNNEKFEIEESRDGISFQTIGEVKGNNTTSELQEYSFEIESPKNGISYYRLKQIDIDGEFEISDIIGVNFIGGNEHVGQINPNPSKSGLVHLNYASKFTENITVSVFDVRGQLILNQSYSVSIGNNILNLDFSGLDKGIYLVGIKDKITSVFSKLIIER